MDTLPSPNLNQNAKRRFETLTKHLSSENSRYYQQK